ncbi:MAG: hypothetical protein II563_04715 [Treponema sp.]|nr:hypothetical protein [Treponema sp.]
MRKISKSVFAMLFASPLVFAQTAERYSDNNIEYPSFITDVNLGDEYTFNPEDFVLETFEVPEFNGEYNFNEDLSATAANVDEILPQVNPAESLVLTSSSGSGLETFEPEDLQTPSRSIKIAQNQYLDVEYPGKGWIYLGETDNTTLMRYFGHTLSSDTTFTLRAKSKGTALLHFYKIDPLTGTAINDYLEVIIAGKTTSEVHAVAPSYKEKVPAGQRKKAETKQEQAEDEEDEEDLTEEEESIEAVTVETYPQKKDETSVIAEEKETKTEESETSRSESKAQGSTTASTGTQQKPASNASSGAKTQGTGTASTGTQQKSASSESTTQQKSNAGSSSGTAGAGKSSSASTGTASNASSGTKTQGSSTASAGTQQKSASTATTTQQKSNAGSSTGTNSAGKSASNTAGTQQKSNASSKNTTVTSTADDELLAKAQKAYNSGSYAECLDYLTEFFNNAVTKIDEALYLQGLALEAPSSSRNIKAALDTYETLVKGYPQSKKWNAANERVIYIKRFYFNIR